MGRSACASGCSWSKTVLARSRRPSGFRKREILRCARGVSTELQKRTSIKQWLLVGRAVSINKNIRTPASSYHLSGINT